MKPLRIAGLFGAVLLAGAQTPELERVQRILNDWPNLARYRDANRTVAPGSARVVFLGASIIELWGGKHSSLFPGKPYLNRGISGQTTPQMLVRLRPDVLALKPEVVVIMGGGNDLAGNTGPARVEDIQGNLMSMAELAKANGIRVVLSSLTPACDAPGERRPLDRILALNAWMKDYAAANGHVYLDWYTVLKDGTGLLRRELTYDCLHPNEAGYAVMAPVAEKAIEEALKR